LSPDSSSQLVLDACGLSAILGCSSKEGVNDRETVRLMLPQKTSLTIALFYPEDGLKRGGIKGWGALGQLLVPAMREILLLLNFE